MQSKTNNRLFEKYKIWTILLQFLFIANKAQIANYVHNGGFEQVIPNVNPVTAKYWLAIDSLSFYGKTLSTSLPPFNAPLNGTGYQWPKKGNNYFGSSLLFNDGTAKIRGYPKNRLKGKLKTGVTYCVKFYCNITNNSTHGVDGLGAYFGDGSLDTISHCTVPLTYLIPQVKNPDGNLLTDTLSWIPITGTFVASGIEKYLILGNFKSDVATNTVLINSSQLPTIGTDVLIDDVSCIDINLSAFAGRDTIVLPGSNVFIGREPDVGIDEACMWYKLPDMTNSIDTVAGFWINPTSTSTYVVRQQLWCNNSPKWDTVIIKVDPTVGIFELNPSAGSVLISEVELFPNPANDFLEIKIKSGDVSTLFNRLTIYNSLGRLVREESTKTQLNIQNLPEGVYFLELKHSSTSLRVTGTVRKRFVIAR